MAAERYRVEPLGPHHDRTGFSCGVEPLDSYFRERAGQDLRRKLAVPYVLTDVATGPAAGYYTLSSLSILADSLPEEIGRAILIGRLAVDQRYRGQGLGERLLLDAVQRCVQASQQVGAMAVVVDAKDEAARAFYERYGFRRFLDHEYRLYLAMATAAQLWG